MTSFVFNAYLATIIQNNIEIAIEPLTGGYTNFTVRATFDPPANVFSRTLRTVILKYAPPYIATEPSQPLGVRRQAIEVKALRLLAGADDGISGPPGGSSKMRIPECIHHDTEKNVLWMTDLGDMQSLSEYLSLKSANHEVLERVAVELGIFITELYRRTREPSEELIAQLANPSHTADTFAYIANMTRVALNNARIPDADVLSERVRSALKPGASENEVCLGMNDFWPGSLLISKDGGCGLIDWEYFGPSDPASELGMFFAHLHILLLKSTSSPKTIAGTRTFINTLAKTYAKEQEDKVLSLQFRRRLLIAHGRELINGIGLYSGKLDEVSKRRILDVGIQSLRAAGDGDSEVDDSLKSSNGDIWESFSLLGL